ncbi:MAG: glycosyltransferase [Pseudomonadota bacterium]|nr:glycosyltransferase [Pseudomonadota bacterium]
MSRRRRAQTPSDSDFGIIVHCHLRWNFVWQRPQQIFSRLAESNPVLFIEDPMDAAEPHVEITQPLSNVVRLVPMLPLSSAPTVDEQCSQLVPMIERVLQEHPLLAGRFERPVQWFYSPMTAPCFAGRFNARALVYDCMDELANFRFAPPDIAERERMLLSRADVVFTGGRSLHDAKSRHHDNVYFHGCGVDVEHFGKARLDETSVADAVASLPRPVFGYVGVIDERLDYELIDQLAVRFPGASLVMAGPLAKVERDQLPDRPNIHWLGQRDYAELPSLVKGFDVCLMPFALNDATRYINPTKTLEYMAAGRPVVSTAIADVVSNFTPIVDVAHSPEEFVRAVERAWMQRDDERIREGVERASGASWDSTVATMRDELLDAVVQADRSTTARPTDPDARRS